MAANKNTAEYEEIDEAEEEALLKSDDESEAARAKASLTVVSPPGDDDSLMDESVRLAVSGDDAEKGISDDDTDDDDVEDGTEKSLAEYKNTLKELEKDQYSYEKFVRLCELSHATGDLDMIRKAYDLFASVYPLSPDLWLKYLRIEINVALSPNEVTKVEELFRRSLKDYYSTEIALEFSVFSERSSNPEGIWRELLDTYALHCMQGQEFFKRYRKFLSNSSRSAEEKEDAYIQSFLRELKYPLNNMEESYIEFKVFYEKNKAQIKREIDWEIVDKDYYKAKEYFLKIIHFEHQLDTVNAKSYRERAEVYKNYIKASDKFLDENILQTIYERFVADCCLNAEHWLTYIEFLDYRDEFGRPEELCDSPVFLQTAIDVNNRALRNCTWSEKLYIKRIHLMEKQDKTREEIQEVLETSMNAGFQTAEPAVAIWLEYLTYLRRHTDWENEGECDIIRKNFNLAWTILGQQWGVLADCDCEILQFWGRLEYGPLRNLRRGKDLWTTVMESSDNAKKSGLWIEFTQMEMRRDLESTRKLFHKALLTPGIDNPAVIASAWERFERCNGTLKTLTACSKECTAFLMQYRAQNEHFHGNPGTFKPTKTTEFKGTKRKSTGSTEGKEEKRSKTKESHDTKAPTAVAERHQSEHPFKEHETQEIDLTKDHLRIFLSNLDYNLTVDDICAGLPEIKISNVDLIRSANGKSRGFGYLELESAAEVEKALALDRRTLSGRPVFISSVLRDKEKRQKFKYSDGLEPKKLFVKGLPPDTTSDELKELFAKYGKIKDVRLVHHKSGKFKNIAYVEYEDENAAGKAIMGIDETELRGHIVSVAISAPPPKPAANTINPSRLLAINTKRNKVYDQKPRMSLIPNVLRKKFSAAGEMPPPLSADVATTTAINGAVASGKTNEDFRKLLRK